MPKLPKSEARRHLQRSLEKIPELTGMGTGSQEFIKWRRNTKVAIERSFGEDSKESREFGRIRYSPVVVALEPGPSNLSEYAVAYQSGLRRATAILESMIEEIDIFWPDEQPVSHSVQAETENRQIDERKVFLVHGRDDGTLSTVARTLEQLGLDPIVLQEQPNQGRTIIEKFEDYAGTVGFAVVLGTPDDEGRLISEQELRPRMRQNVIFELGYFAGKIGRGRVVALTKGDVEIPSDYSGVLYIPLDEQGVWRMNLVRELKSAGFQVDANRLL